MKKKKQNGFINYFFLQSIVQIVQLFVQVFYNKNYNFIKYDFYIINATLNFRKLVLIFHYFFYRKFLISKLTFINLIVLTWASEMGNLLVKTVHITFSLHVGVVKEPPYRKKPERSRGRKLEAIICSVMSTA